MSKTPIQKSDASQIKTLEGTEAIRHRPGMYIGQLGSRGVFRLFAEAVGNVLDLYAEGAADKMYIGINERTGEIIVADNGYGMPLEKVEDIFCKTHTSGKFENNGFSIGMNGVGNKCINALSEQCLVLVKRDGYKWKMSFSKGKPTSKLIQLEETNETGTTVKFKPDAEIMGEYDIDSQVFLEFIETLSYLSKGLEIDFHAVTKDKKSITKKFLSKNGILDYIKAIEKNGILKEPIYIEDKSEDRQVYIALNYSAKRDEELMLSYVNNMATKEHGTHVQGLRAAMTRIIKKYIEDNNLIPKKDGKIEITGDDVAEGLSAIIEVKWIEPMFDSQTKDNLTTSEVSGYVRKVVADQLSTYFTKNKADAKLICNKVILAAKGRAAAKRAKTATKKKESGFTSISSLSKFTKASNKDPEQLELFIVEGNSAGGSCSQARDTDTQAVYRLRGKPLNTHDTTAIKIMANKEFNDIINILGCGIDKTFDISKLSHHKIVIMSDADIDGCHITSLVTTFFYKHMPELIEKGYVYAAQPPLYKIRENGKDLYIKDREEYNTYIFKKITSNFTMGNLTNQGLSKYSTAKFEELLKITSNYLFTLNNVASKFATDPELIEYICLCKGVDYKNKARLIANKFPTLEVQELGGGLFIDGLIGSDYQSIVINDNLYLDLKPVTDILSKLDVTNPVIKGRNDAKARKVSLYSLLNEVYKFATPAHMTRFKGLTKN